MRWRNCLDIMIVSLTVRKEYTTEYVLAACGRGGVITSLNSAALLRARACVKRSGESCITACISNLLQSGSGVGRCKYILMYVRTWSRQKETRSEELKPCTFPPAQHPVRLLKASATHTSSQQEKQKKAQSVRSHWFCDIGVAYGERVWPFPLQTCTDSIGHDFPY